MACCLTAPSHYLNQCSLTISEVMWISPESNFTARVQTTLRCNEFQNYILLKLLSFIPWANQLVSELTARDTAGDVAVLAEAGDVLGRAIGSGDHVAVQEGQRAPVQFHVGTSEFVEHIGVRVTAHTACLATEELGCLRGKENVSTRNQWEIRYIDCLVHDCSNSSALSLEFPQSCDKPKICIVSQSCEWWWSGKD